MEDLAEDVIMDLRLTKELYGGIKELDGKMVKGYIQRLLVEPFGVLFYTQRQLQVLHDLLKRNRNLCLHYDATGNVVTPLGAPFTVARLFYYAIVVTSNGTDSPGVPICEYLTSNHAVPSLTGMLQQLLHE